MSYFVMSFFFRLDAAQIGRAIRRLEPLLLGIIKLQKSQKISEEEASMLLIDATEQSISRPKKFQKNYYSGKKKFTHSQNSACHHRARPHFICLPTLFWQKS
jgi:hypothetical protein